MASIFRPPYRVSRQFSTQRTLFQRPASPVRELSQSNFTLLDSTEKLEEETLSWYSPDSFCPVRIGEVFQSRYHQIDKLGYGGYSTVWLCRDLQQHAYVALKAFECNSTEGQSETEIYHHLNSLNIVDHAGLPITSPECSFGCLVHPPFGVSLYDFHTQLRAKVFPERIVKLALVHVLALDFLHIEAGIVHTANFEEEEKSSPSPRKIVGDRVIYASRKLKETKQNGRPTLCDFGQARRGSNTYCGDIQPYIYRTPEVLLQMPWNEKVDIWNVGVLTWDLFQQGHLLYARDSDKKSSDAHHLAEMIAIMGPPPKEMLRNSVYATEFFDGEGDWKGAIEIPSRTLEKLEGNLEGEPQRLFLQFVRKMLRWKLEARGSARKLLDDPWLRTP
ncbi:kinase-like domain-containing protein [Aspergillus tamarii]|uniref:non-specific serine/threonine protein kinase n=1 Tax=Aspergillus tamarii TaxID=41984 RepID=A0A5N6V0Y7_ASPTM|nr:kinase-like domain-containing protein [Aspergillus tamarii]